MAFSSSGGKCTHETPPEIESKMPLSQKTILFFEKFDFFFFSENGKLDSRSTFDGLLATFDLRTHTAVAV